MENDTGTEAAKSEAVVEDTKVEETADTTDYKALYDEEVKRAKDLSGRLKRAETKIERDRINDAVEDKVEKVLSKNNTDELTDAQSDFFALKGYEDDEEQEILHKVMKRSGMTHREVIKDEWALSKIDAYRADKKVKQATPSSTKRSGQSDINDVGHWLGKIDAGTARLSDIQDFATRVKVQQAREAREGDNAAPWRR